MFIVMEEGATETQVESVIGKLVDSGFTVHRSTGVVHTVLGCVGPKEEVDPRAIEMMDGVQECHRILSPYKLASRKFRPEGTRLQVRGVEIGGPAVIAIAGPCGVESRELIELSAQQAARAGAKGLRSGSFELREDALRMLRDAADRSGLFVLSEVQDHTQIPMMSGYVDMFQVGSRNMQNFSLLKALSKSKIPVMLKRGISATIEELLLSAEYLLAGGNYNVVLCERGIRTFETYTRHTMDISAIPVVKKLSHLPIMADPSHATGRRDKVIPMARAAVAAGADGILVEVHPTPDKALSDGAQSLFPNQFEELMRQLRMIAAAVGRTI
ncbi:MAG: 3-deoxy-7-phosphoheptulonate synthase [Candidatus Solibacter usitatus]|nr:3-deoxy-7-phosphoheptulonate synthase [Candidatus Solibacter usitatus]